MRNRFLSILFLILPLWAYADDPQKTLMVFFRSDCPPCHEEMKIIPVIAQEHREINIDVVALDKLPDKKDFSGQLPENMHMVMGHDKGMNLLKDSGDDTLTLPFSLLMREDGGICKKHYGLLGTELVNKWLQTC